MNINNHYKLNKNKVAVGMSGGVDSTAAAYILKQRGYEVIGITMQVCDGDCNNYIDDAKKIANEIGIEHYVVNLKEIFKEKVIDYFIADYMVGRTPNPCIACNRYIKFDALIQTAHSYGAYYIATGHYSGVEYDENNDRYLVKCAKDISKDQTYMFWTLRQEQLRYILTPLSNIGSKNIVRDIACKFDINANDKSDSQEICFIPDNDHVRYLIKNINTSIPEGNFVDVNGNILGKHKGIINYTIGQRKGLGITFGKPMYVIDIRYKTNEIVLGENERVFAKELIANDINFILFDKLDNEIRAYAKIRSHAKLASCVIKPIDDISIKVIFDKPQRAITAGQSVVFYLENDFGDMYMIGGAVINFDIS